MRFNRGDHIFHADARPRLHYAAHVFTGLLKRRPAQPLIVTSRRKGLVPLSQRAKNRLGVRLSIQQGLDFLAHIAKLTIFGDAQFADAKMSH